MGTIRARILGLIATVIGLTLITLEAQKTVQLQVNGEARTLSTYAFTVGGLLREAQIPVGEADYLEPSVNDWLSEGENVILERATRVRIQEGEKTLTLLSTERIPANILASAGVELFPGDRLLYNGLPVSPQEPLPRAKSYSLQIQKARPLRITANGQARTVYSSAPTVGQALWREGIGLFTADHLEPESETPLAGLTRVTIRQSQPLEIQTKDAVLHVRTTESAVGAALAEAGISLQGLDYSIPGFDAPLPANGKVRVVHVEEQVSLETEPLPFEIEYQPAPDLELDKQTVLEPGTFGIKARRIRVRLEDGEEVSRQVESEFIAQEPKSRILGYGTKIVPHTINVSGNTIKYWRALNMYAVSYNPTSAGGNITASGLPLRKGLVAVDPNYIALGTRLYVPGYGEALAADTGGGVKGRIIDLGYSDHDYVAWHQWVTVYFLWPPPENVAWVIP